MGCGASAPKVEETKPRPAARIEPAAPKVPCRGLCDTHEYIKELGRGGTGETFLYKDKQTGELVAVKLIRRPLPKVIQANILREIMIQANLGEGHVNVINAYEAILTESHLALLMEYAACGSLTSYVANRWQHAQHSGLFLSEDEARYFFRQFIAAVEYCHIHLVAHRDLKLDNTLLDKGSPPMLKLCDFGFAKTWESNEEANMYTHIGDLKLDNTLLSDDEPPLLKLCDFGFARKWEGQNNAQMYTHIGGVWCLNRTPVYMSPELINSRNGAKGYDGKQVDVWASGVLLIVMLLGTFPFDHTENPDPNTSEAHLEVWMQQIRTPWTDIAHIKNAVEKLSPECTDLLNRIFVIDEKKRITIPEIKQHAWYTRPLLPKYAAAEADIVQRQAQVEEYIRRRDLNIGLINERNKKLETLVNAAAGPPVPQPHAKTCALDRIDLREEACLGGAGEPGTGNGPAMPALALGSDLHDITEDGTEGTDQSTAGSTAANGVATPHAQ